jgi:hypothetical protein
MITRRSRQIGAAAQWASPGAVTLRNTTLRVLPPSSFTRSLTPYWTGPRKRHRTRATTGSGPTARAKAARCPRLAEFASDWSNDSMPPMGPLRDRAGS